MSNDAGSVTGWLDLFKAGDREVVRHLWDRYFSRLMHLARRKLQNRAPRADADEEDVALSAFKSFCRAAERNRFPDLDDREDLWQILVMLTVRKAEDRLRYANRQRRDWKNTQSMDTNVASSTVPTPPATESLVNGEPDPAFAAEIEENCRLLLDTLPDDECREIAVAKMEGWTNRELADQLGYSPSTVERRLWLIRRCWMNEAEAEAKSSR